MMDNETKKEIEDMFLQFIKTYSRTKAYADKKITDNPTDALDVVNRRWLTLNGSVASRPPSSVAVVGQRYLATDTAIPMFYTTAGWVNGVGSIVAQNN